MRPTEPQIAFSLVVLPRIRQIIETPQNYSNTTAYSIALVHFNRNRFLAHADNSPRERVNARTHTHFHRQKRGLRVCMSACWLACLTRLVSASARASEKWAPNLRFFFFDCFTLESFSIYYWSRSLKSDCFVCLFLVFFLFVVRLLVNRSKLHWYVLEFEICVCVCVENTNDNVCDCKGKQQKSACDHWADKMNDRVKKKRTCFTEKPIVMDREMPWWITHRNTNEQNTARIFTPHTHTHPIHSIYHFASYLAMGSCIIAFLLAPHFS